MYPKKHDIFRFEFGFELFVQLTNFVNFDKMKTLTN